MGFNSAFKGLNNRGDLVCFVVAVERVLLALNLTIEK
jgi:hypothetical protein